MADGLTHVEKGRRRLSSFRLSWPAQERPTVTRDAKDLYLRIGRCVSTRSGREEWLPPIRRTSRLSFQSELACYVWTGLNAGEPATTATRMLVEQLVARRRAEYPALKAGRPPAESFFRRAVRLDKAGHIDASLDLIYDAVDELMQKGAFDCLDSILSKMRIDNVSVDILLGLLTSTLPGRSRLPSRPEFFRTVEQVLKKRGEYEEGLLTGLEN